MSRSLFWNTQYSYQERKKREVFVQAYSTNERELILDILSVRCHFEFHQGEVVLQVVRKQEWKSWESSERMMVFGSQLKGMADEVLRIFTFPQIGNLRVEKKMAKDKTSISLQVDQSSLQSPSGEEGYVYIFFLKKFLKQLKPLTIHEEDNGKIRKALKGGIENTATRERERER